jgi:hypothetical protein
LGVVAADGDVPHAEAIAKSKTAASLRMSI